MPQLRLARPLAPWVVALALLGAPVAGAQDGIELPGGFGGRRDIGEGLPPGLVGYDPQTGVFSLAAGARRGGQSGEALVYLWRRLAGDASLGAQVSFPPPQQGGAQRGSAGWLVRQGLEPEAPFAGALLRPDGSLALQYRREQGGPVELIPSPLQAPARWKLERTGDLFTLFAARGEGTDGPWQPVGGVLVRLTEPVFAGLAVVPESAAAGASARFAALEFTDLGSAAPEQRVLESTLEVIDVVSGERRAVYTTRDHIEAPNWSRDGQSFVFNSEGRLYRLPRAGGRPEQIDTGSAQRLNNDHGLSPDGSLLAISDEPEPAGQSLIYVLPAAGGTPRQVTELAPSYWHGWSPDGKTLLYTARRDGEFDVYAISADASRSREERRLTRAPGLDDGPEYSPDGRTIFFNSERSGAMRIWRMNADGSDPRQVTRDASYGDWFPHPSPDGKWLVFLSYDASVTGHPENQEVALRIMPSAGGEPRVLARLFGGQGTINVPSWSPDGRELAFVSYRLLAPAAAPAPAAAR